MRSPARSTAPLAVSGLVCVPALIGAPRWAAGVVLVLALLLGLVQAVFPQDSAHRLTWWRELWRHREFQADSSAKPPGTAPQAVTTRGTKIDESTCESSVSQEKSLPFR